MARGDHLKAGRVGYSHHGVDLGDGRVVHYSGLAEGLRSGPVAVTSRGRFARGRRIRVVRHRDQDPPDVAVERALSRLGEDQYHLLFRNCEHFATWAVTGRSRSPQVRNGVIGAALFAVTTGVGLVATRGRAHRLASNLAGPVRLFGSARPRSSNSGDPT